MKLIYERKEEMKRTDLERNFYYENEDCRELEDEDLVAYVDLTAKARIRVLLMWAGLNALTWLYTSRFDSEACGIVMGLAITIYLTLIMYKVNVDGLRVPNFNEYMSDRKALKKSMLAFAILYIGVTVTVILVSSLLVLLSRYYNVSDLWHISLPLMVYSLVLLVY